MFASHLLSIRFKASSADPFLFILHYATHFIILLLYVDDILITDNNHFATQHLITQVASAFAMKDLGSLQYFRGLEVHRSTDGLLLTQTKSTINTLKKFKIDGASPQLYSIQTK